MSQSMIQDGKIYLGTSTKPEYLELRFANRHGLITGATGTGKTVSLQVLAEGFSAAGVPVFAADIKGDLSGIAAVGEAKDFIVKYYHCIGGYHQAAPQGFESNNLVTYLFGPRISYRTESRVTPFAQVLFGGAYSTMSGQTALAMTAGGGFDLKIAPHVAIRVAQGEYLMTRFGGSTQNNLRISTGLVFQFGGTK